MLTAIAAATLILAGCADSADVLDDELCAQPLGGDCLGPFDPPTDRRAAVFAVRVQSPAA